VFFAAAVVVGSASAFAQADVMKACGAEWQQLKESKQVKPGQTWNSYLADCRKAKAAAPAAAAPAAAAPAAPAKPAAAPAAPAKPAAAAPAAAGAAKFPAAVDPKYAKESAGKQRMHTCLDQYNANKATNGNGGLKWIEKGGGYYSQCNKALGGGGND
jgi:hypothetical protein